MAVERVPLTRGEFALVDEADLELVSRHSWGLYAPGPGQKYAGTRFKDEYGREQFLYMHRFITEVPDALEIDHKNGDGLDNRRENLRPCTRFQNVCNTRSAIGSSSMYKGVSFCKQTGRWKAQIRFDGKQINLGRFVEEEQAAREYDKAVRLIHREFGRLNFPRPGELSAVREAQALDMWLPRHEEVMG